MYDCIEIMKEKMIKMKLLLLSNSTNPGESYLSYPRMEIAEFLKNADSEIVFIPYAAVTFSYDEYEQKVNESLKNVGLRVRSIHSYPDYAQAIRKASAIVIGGGNTWKLVRSLHENKLMNVIREKVIEGTPYVGWSAGSNVACPTLRTTNDMPIVDPLNFETLNLVPFQINPHYLDAHPSNHGGETREMRIEEFISENKDVYVVGLREGTMLRLDDDKLSLIGDRPARIFKCGEEVRELSSAEDFNFLL